MSDPNPDADLTAPTDPPIGAPQSVTSAFPPPPPPGDTTTPSPVTPADLPAIEDLPPMPEPNSSAANESDATRRRVSAIIGAAAIVAALAMGLLWFSAKAARQDAETERDNARIATDLAEENTAAISADFDASQADLAAANDDTARLTAELSTAQSALDTAVTEAAAAAEAADQAATDLATSDAATVALEAQVAELQAAVAAAEAANVAAPPAAVDIAATPALAQYLGEALSSRTAPSVLATDQQSCLGSTVVGDIGVEAVAAGLAAGAAAEAAAVLSDAVSRAAAACAIDPTTLR